MSLLENSVIAAPPLTAHPLVASPLAASDMHWEWVATNSQRILELTLSHLYQGVVPVALALSSRCRSPTTRAVAVTAVPNAASVREPSCTSPRCCTPSPRSRFSC